MRPSLLHPILLAALAAASLAAPAGAQGRVIPRPCAVPLPEERVRPQPCRPPIGLVERVRNNVRVELDNGVLRYEVRETFVNRGGQVGEADYLYPLPAGAAFQELQLQIGDEMVSGEVLDAAKARAIYEEIVRRQRDPALVEWMGRGLLRARIFPIAPGETKRVLVRFATVAPREGDALRVDYTAGTGASGGFAPEPRAVEDDRPRRRGDDEARPAAAQSSFSLRYRAESRFGRPYSPTHALDVRDAGDRREVVARGGGRDLTILLPVRSSREAAIGVLAHRPDGADGFALVTVSPPAGRAAATPRDVTFVIDVSGSMRGEKMEQAKAAGRQLLASLDEGDRFRLVAFASDVRPYAAGWTEATPSRLRAAARWLDELDAEGSTNISGALEEALDVPAARGRLPLVLFLTDGAPTVGERNADRIARRAAELRDGTRVFTFGVGTDVNAELLEQLALEGRGTAHFVRPEESVERAVSVVASRLTNPVLTNVRVTADGVRLLQPQPAGALDLFAGQDLVVLARYRGAGPATVRVEGTSADGPVRWTTRVAFPERARDHGYVARLWATQRVGWLSAERRRSGPSSELDEEIRELGLRYGIPTELSSYLVLEPGMVADAAGNVAPQRRAMRPQEVAATGAAVGRVASAPASAPPPPPAPVVAAQSSRFEAAKAAAEQRAAVSLADVTDTAASADAERRTAGGRTFHRAGEVWTDARWTGTLPVVRVRPFGAGWFRLVELLPELREPFALGDRVRVQGRAIAIEVAPDGPETVPAEALQRIRTNW